MIARLQSFLGKTALTERPILETQTARNLEGMEREREGCLDSAVALYELNAAGGFAGDWPYSRLVSIYSARGQWDQVARVLERGLEVLRTSRARSASDRRVLKKVYEGRLKEALQKLAASGSAAD